MSKSKWFSNSSENDTFWVIFKHSVVSGRWYARKGTVLYMAFNNKPLKTQSEKKKFFCYFYYALRDARCDFWVSVTSFWGALFILWKKFQASYFSFFFSCSLSPLWQKTEKSLLHIQSSLSSWTSKKSGKQSRIESCSIIKVQLYITVPVSVEYMLTSPAPFQKVRIFLWFWCWYVVHLGTKFLPYVLMEVPLFEMLIQFNKVKTTASLYQSFL